jgi:hypothetical protein
MNVAPSHEMSHVNCLYSEAYIEVGRDPWQRARNLFFVIFSLFESPKEALIFSKITSKLSRRGD